MDVSKTAGTLTTSLRGGRARRQESPVRRHVVVLVVVAALVGFAGCAVQSPDAVAVAQAKVSDKEKALTEAQAAAGTAAAALCAASAAYITALDAYGDLLVQTAPTVGDVRNAGKDLVEPRAETVQAAEALVSAREAVTKAEQELADAQAALAAAQASAAGTTPSPSKASQEPAKSPSAPPAGVTRVQQAEAEFAATSKGINDQTPLRRAGEQFNSAAVALEMAWLQLFAESGCLSNDQQEQAAEAVQDYTKTLQQALTDAGYYEGKVDGIYGPQTVAAVEALQKAHDLPQTGAMDKATEAALRAELAASGAASSQQDTATTAAVQQTLKLAGYWDGPVDGVWTDELTDALKEFQTDLGVPATGEVDAATIAALEKALANAGQTPTPSPSKTSPTPPSPSPTSTSS